MGKSLLVIIVLAGAARAGIVTDVRSALARRDFAGAAQEVAAYRKQNGVTPELLVAMSWLGRGALAQRKLNEAERYAQETRTLVVEQLKSRKLEADKDLALALGAAIELQAGVLAERGGRSEAVSYLRRELKTYWTTPLHARIQMNLNLLTLEGKPAPPLDVRHWLGPRPESLEALRGRPVLLCFWAHWCGDCRDEIPTLVEIERRFASRGLVLMGPTRTYGYAARGEDASPQQEMAYIDRVRAEVYAPLGRMTVPLGEENFKVYGASTVPTLVLIDRQGIVRLYHPDVMGFDELAAAVEKVLSTAP